MKPWPLFLLPLGLIPVLFSAAANAVVPEPSVADRVQQFVRAELERSQAQSATPLRAEIVVGDIDARLHLAPCEHTEVFLRPGARLWGRSFVGYRCLQRPGWSVSVPVLVRLYGPVAIAAQPLPALQPIPAAAVRVGELEVTQELGGVVKDPGELEDKVCARALEPGQAIPLNCLRTLPAVTQGDPVKLVGFGSGFSVTTEGTAMATAGPGELVHVRTDSGHTVAGVARRGRVVEVTF